MTIYTENSDCIIILNVTLVSSVVRSCMNMSDFTQHSSLIHALTRVVLQRHLLVNIDFNAHPVGLGLKMKEIPT